MSFQRGGYARDTGTGSGSLFLVFFGGVIGLASLFIFPWGVALAGGMLLGTLWAILSELHQIRRRLERNGPPPPKPPGES